MHPKTKRSRGRPKLAAVPIKKLKAAKAVQLADTGGRPIKPDKHLFAQVTCVLRRETINQLRALSKSRRFFGEVLQDHLDRYPLPTRQEYRDMQQWEESIRKAALTPLKPHAKNRA
jgi:hypothetical protein